MCQTKNPCRVRENISSSTSPNQLEKCEITNCVGCEEDHTKCTKCNPLTSFTMPGSEITVCHDSNTIPPGYGIDRSGAIPQLKRCQTPATHCSSCRSNYQECEECPLKYPYHKEATPPYSECYDASTIPGGYGVGVTSTSQGTHTQAKAQTPGSSTTVNTNIGRRTHLVSCSDHNCGSCSHNSAVCTKCKDHFYFKVDSGTAKKTCVGCDQDGEWKESSTGLCNTCHGTCKIFSQNLYF